MMFASFLFLISDMKVSKRNCGNKKHKQRGCSKSNRVKQTFILGLVRDRHV